MKIYLHKSIEILQLLDTGELEMFNITSKVLALSKTRPNNLGHAFNMDLSHMLFLFVLELHD